MNNYVIYTKNSGYVFYICHNDIEGYYVSSDAPDNEVLKTDYETAKGIAENNSKGDVKYEIKQV